MEDPEQTSVPHQLWIFPQLASEVEFEPFRAIENSSTEDNFIVTSEPNAAQDLEVQKLKEELQEKIQLVSQLQAALQQKMNQVNQELLVQLVECIKKVTQKIIAHTLKENPEHLKNMIAGQLAMIKGSSGGTIFVSADDFEQLKSEQFENPSLKIEIDAKLQRGDFKIYTPTTEIVALLEARLLTCFGLSP